jgi:hypothetical protein
MGYMIEKLLSIDRSDSVLIQEIIGRRGLATGYLMLVSLN